MEEPRRHAATERLVEHRERIAVGIIAAQRTHAEHHLRLLGRALEHGERSRCRLAVVELTGGTRARAVADCLLDQVDHLVVVEVPGRGDHHVARVVVAGVEAGDVVRVHGLDRLRRADHLAADRMLREHRFGEHVVHEVFRCVVVHPDLFEDHFAFRIDVFGPQRGSPHDVAEDLECELQALVGHAYIERRHLLGRERVHVATNRLDGLGDRRRGPSLGAL